MRSGRLRFRVTIQQPTLIPDGMGGGESAWNDVATVWADVTTTNGNSNMESFTGNQFRTIQYFNVKMRYRNDLTTKMRLLYYGRVLEILSIVNFDERKKEINLYCKEGG
jgi:SPP1 family predicted phage head-tail adaptor